MDCFGRSLEQIREERQRQLAAMRKTRRRRKFSLYGSLAPWTACIGILPFTTSHDQLLLMFGLFTLICVRLSIHFFRQ